jgi:hypothetical protein
VNDAKKGLIFCASEEEREMEVVDLLIRTVLWKK